MYAPRVAAFFHRQAIVVGGPVQVGLHMDAVSVEEPEQVRAGIAAGGQPNSAIAWITLSRSSSRMVNVTSPAGCMAGSRMSAETGSLPAQKHDIMKWPARSQRPFHDRTFVHIERHERGHTDRHRSGQACFSSARTRCKGARGISQEAHTLSTIAVLHEFTGRDGCHGGLRGITLAGTSIDRHGTCRQAHIAAVCPSICEEQQKRLR